MGREYTHEQEVEKEILEMKEVGKTNREIAECFGFKDKYVVKWFMARYHRKQRQLEACIVPRRRGRPPKGGMSTQQEKDNEIRRLKMENELLQDFLHAVGRR